MAKFEEPDVEDASTDLQEDAGGTKRHLSWWKIALGVLFLPFTLTWLLLKSKRLDAYDKRLRIGAAVALWIVLIAGVVQGNIASAALAQARTLDINAVEISQNTAVIKGKASNDADPSWNGKAKLIIHYAHKPDVQQSLTVSVAGHGNAGISSQSFDMQDVTGIELIYDGARITYSAGDLVDLLHTEQQKAETLAKKKAEEEAAAAKKAAEEAEKKKAEEAAKKAEEERQKAEQQAAEQKAAQEKAAQQQEAQQQAAKPATTAAAAPTQAPQSRTVYMVPNSNVYHIDGNCRTLRRSKTILTATEEEAQAKGRRVCKVCG